MQTKRKRNESSLEGNTSAHHRPGKQVKEQMDINCNLQKEKEKGLISK